MPTPVDCYTTLSRAELLETLKEIILWLLQEISPYLVNQKRFIEPKQFSVKDIYTNNK